MGEEQQAAETRRKGEKDLGEKGKEKQSEKTRTAGREYMEEREERGGEKD